MSQEHQELNELQAELASLQKRKVQSVLAQERIREINSRIGELTASLAVHQRTATVSESLQKSRQEVIDVIEKTRSSIENDNWRAAIRHIGRAKSKVEAGPDLLVQSDLEDQLYELLDYVESNYEAPLRLIESTKGLAELIANWRYDEAVDKDRKVTFIAAGATTNPRLMPLRSAYAEAKKRYGVNVSEEIRLITIDVRAAIEQHQLDNAERISQRRFEIPGMFGPSAILTPEETAELMKPLQELIDQINVRKEGWRKADNHLTTARHFLSTENYRSAQEAYWKAVDADPRHPGLEDVRQSLQRYVVLLLRRVLDKVRVAEARQDWSKISAALEEADTILRVHNERVAMPPAPNSVP